MLIDTATMARISRATTHLEGAYLYGAHLVGAHLREAHLEGATLIGPHLDGADLSVAIGDARTWLPDGVARPAEWPPYAP